MRPTTILEWSHTSWTVMRLAKRPLRAPYAAVTPNNYPAGATRRTNVSFASGESVVPAHGHIDGGLWPNADCAPRESAEECLRMWLGGSTELILTTDRTNVKVHITMDRDSDPLGIRK